MPVKYYIFTLLFFLSSLSASQNSLDEYRFYALEEPPYSYIENNNLTGRNVELVKRLISVSGARNRGVDLMPHSRALLELDNSEKVAVFPVEKSSDNKNKYKWVGPLMRPMNKKVLVAMSDLVLLDNDVFNNKDLVFGAIKEDPEVQFIINFGVKEGNFVYASSQEQLFELLEKNRCQVILTRLDLLAWYKNKYNKGNFTILPTYIPGGMRRHYIALPQNTPENIIELLKSSLQSIKKDEDFQSELELDFGF